MNRQKSHVPCDREVASPEQQSEEIWNPWGNAAACAALSGAGDEGGGDGLLDGLLADDPGFSVPGDVADEARNSFGSVDDVRVHTGPAAAELAAEKGLAAFAVGRDVFFAAGRYQPDDPDGRFILLHELAHAVQQGDAGGQEPDLSGAGAGAEAQADQAASAALTGESSAVTAAPVSMAGFSATARTDEHGNRVDTDICHENQTMEAADAAGLSEEEASHVYSGNWQQDMNQVLLPALDGHLEALITALGPAIYEAINICHFAHFGFGLDGSEEFGSYDPVDHIDNPGGQYGDDVFDQSSPASADANENAGSADDPFIELDDRYADAYDHMKENRVGEVYNADDPEAYQVDESGIPVYMTASALAMHDALDSAARMGGDVAEDDGLQLAGAALHVMQDFYAHSNFCEIAINILLDGSFNEAGELDPDGALSFEEAFGIQVGEYHLDTGVHAIDEDGNVSEENLSHGGREVMATGTFTDQDTWYSIGEKCKAAIEAVNPFEAGAEGPSDIGMGICLWLESNPEFGVTGQDALVGVLVGGLEALIPFVSTLVEAAGAAAGAAATVEGVVADLLGDEEAAAAAEAEAAEISAATDELAATIDDLALAMGEGNVLLTAYQIAFAVFEPISHLYAWADRVPLVSDEIVDFLKTWEDDAREEARKHLEEWWLVGQQMLIDQLGEAIENQIGDTDVADDGASTSSTMTQPTHTDLAKDFDPNEHQVADGDPDALLDDALESAHAAFDDLDAAADEAIALFAEVEESVVSESQGSELAQAQAHLEETWATTVTVPAVVADPEAVTSAAEAAVSDVELAVADIASDSGEEAHDHGGAWLAPLADTLATDSSTAILTSLAATWDGGSEAMEANIAAMHSEIDVWFAHPADCKGTWSSVFAAALSAQDADGDALREELAARTHAPPGEQIEHEHSEGEAHDEEEDQTPDFGGDTDIAEPGEIAEDPEVSGYVVQSGDSLWCIAEEQLGDPYRWTEIYELNHAVIGADPNLIEPGMVLVLPDGPTQAPARPEPPGVELPEEEEGGSASGEGEVVIDVEWHSQYDEQFGRQNGYTAGDTACFNTASAMVSDATDGEVSASGETMWLTDGEEDAQGRVTVDRALAAEALAYIDSELEKGHPVVVGVSCMDFEAYAGWEPNIDKVTDHFVTITGRTSVDGEVAYLFNDPALLVGMDDYGEGTNLGAEGWFTVDGVKLVREGEAFVDFASTPVCNTRYEVTAVTRNA